MYIYIYIYIHIHIDITHTTYTHPSPADGRQRPPARAFRGGSQAPANSQASEDTIGRPPHLLDEKRHGQFSKIRYDKNGHSPWEL